jgi:predicted nucleic acid-binding protein
VAALVDTNVLVYRFDPRDPVKKGRALSLLRSGIEDDSLRIAHQAVTEFMVAVSRPLPGVGPLLEPADARRETEELLRQYPVLYPDAPVVRTALHGMAAYELSWWDAHMWAYAEIHGLETPPRIRRSSASGTKTSTCLPESRCFRTALFV